MKNIFYLGILIVAMQCAIAQTSPHGTIKIACENCHTTNSWKMRPDAQFLHASTGFELTGMHTTVECRGCHPGLKFSGVSSACQSCHTDIHKGELGSDCLRCHSTKSTKIPDMVERHQQTRFPLLGQHAAAPCQSCHARNANQQYTGTPTTCIGCHRIDFQNAKNPSHTFAGFSTDCSLCHLVTAPSWGGNFDHQATAFPLTGAHRTTPCSKCHTANIFKSTSKDCYICHLSAFNAVQNPNHAAGRFSHQCTQCHTTNAWKPSLFDHSVTAFQLVGAHRTVTCDQCHINNQFSGLAQKCIDCHRTDFNAVKNPNHATGLFSNDCLSCHTMNSWKPATFDHSTTKFALSGKHFTLQCQDCHIGGNYQLSYSNCYQCHQADYQQTTNPNHIAGNFGMTCETCHSTTSWSSTSFDHTKTNFVLTGKHVTTQCATCHTNNNYQLVYSNCYQCHQADYQQTTNPNHIAGNFGMTCETCHSTTSWSSTSFDHTKTNFVLTGKHVTTQCAACHTNNNYQLVYSNCYQCHQTDYQLATNPNHIAGNFGTTCETCHSTNSWSSSSFDHTITKFALTGKHTTTQCSSCHTNNNYQIVYTTCYVCHQVDYQKPVNPKHVPNGFAYACEQCHTTVVWTPSTFSHDNTKFPLLGAHKAIFCNSCHVNDQYANLHQNCLDCHQTNFNTVTNPNHVTGGFSSNCLTCHTMNAWKPATFDHSTTKFALSGKHITLQCQDCHTGGNYQLVYSNCYQCHQTDYQNVTNPNHVAGNFGTTCESCHNTNGWTPALFDHTKTNFALTGKHSTTSCALCHVNNNYQLAYTSCFVCHQTNYQQATNPSHSVGYPQNCDMCHSTTDWLSSTFNHDVQYFKIYSGKHRGRWTTCSKCHTVPSDFVSFSCLNGCHSKSSTDSDHKDVPNYIYASPNCYSCHRSV